MADSFIGRHNITLDDKGRFNVPSKVKTILEENYGPNLVICVKSNYLLVFPRKEWDVITEKLKQIDVLDDNERERMRKVYALAAECEIKSGKILIPANQREQVELAAKKDALLVGMGTSFEIWSHDKWAAKNSG